MVYKQGYTHAYVRPPGKVCIEELSQECLSLCESGISASLSASISHQPGKRKGNQSPMCVLSF